MLGGRSGLRYGLQGGALLGHKVWALDGEGRLTGVDAVAAGDRKAGNHAGDRTAHDPQLWRRDHDLGGIGKSLVGWARNGVYDANSKARCLLRAEFQSILCPR